MQPDLKNTAVTRKKLSGEGGTTLVEVMIAAVMFSLVTVTVVMAMGHAYRLTVQIKYRDQARFILASVSDQFRTAVTDIPDATVTPPRVLRTIFEPTTTETGTGLCWFSGLGVFMLSPTKIRPPYLIEGDAANGLEIPLGDPTTTTTVQGHLWRRVQTVNGDTGLPTGAAPTAAGTLLRGDFRITFKFMGKEFQQSTTVLRLIEPK